MKKNWSKFLNKWYFRVTHFSSHFFIFYEYFLFDIIYLCSPRNHHSLWLISYQIRSPIRFRKISNKIFLKIFDLTSSNVIVIGQLLHLVKKQEQNPLSFQQVLKIFSQTCRAVAHMHKQTPAIIHRDLKVYLLVINIHLSIWNQFYCRLISPDRKFAQN